MVEKKENYFLVRTLNSRPADIFSRARGLNVGLSLHPHPYFVYVSREGSGECAFVQVHVSIQMSENAFCSIDGHEK